METVKPTVREVVASFPDRSSFETAVDRLLAAGFDRAALSVLATHDSLEIAGGIAGYEPGKPGAVAAGLAGELGFVGSLGVAGVLLLASGPIGAAAAALVGAAAGVVALRPLMDELTESAHAQTFADAVEAGRILLWVRTAGPAEAAGAMQILSESGGTDMRTLNRPARESRA